jgi:hypothetical protein
MARGRDDEHLRKVERRYETERDLMHVILPIPPPRALPMKLRQGQVRSCDVCSRTICNPLAQFRRGALRWPAGNERDPMATSTG